jgi:hypothetical protein
MSWVKSKRLTLVVKRNTLAKKIISMLVLTTQLNQVIIDQTIIG